MKIVQLTAENVKRLTAVSIAPDGNLVQITGRNGQGKASVLDAIFGNVGSLMCFRLGAQDAPLLAKQLQSE